MLSILCRRAIYPSGIHSHIDQKNIITKMIATITSTGSEWYMVARTGQPTLIHTFGRAAQRPRTFYGEPRYARKHIKRNCATLSKPCRRAIYPSEMKITYRPK